MKKIIYFLVLLLSLLICMISCSDDDCNEIHDGDIQDIPNIIKGSFPAEKLTPAIGEDVVFAPKLFNSEGVNFEWTLNGNTIMEEDGKTPYTGTKYTYKVEKPCRVKIGLKLKKNNATVNVESEIVSLPDFSKGFMVLQSNNELGIYDQNANKFYNDCYGSLNAGAKMPSGSINATISGNKLYLLGRTSTSNVNHLAVCDLATLSFETSKQLAANLLNFIPLNDRYVLVTDSWDVYRLDLRTYHITKLKRPAKTIYTAGLYNGKLLTNTTYSSNSNMFYFDVDTLLNANAGEPILATEITGTTQNKKSNIVVAKDGFAYTICVIDNVHKLVKINKDFTTEAIDLPFSTVKPGWSAIYYATLVASPTENAIYIPAADHSIYKYEIGNPASLDSPFMAVPDGSAKLYGSAVVAHPTDGSVHVIYNNYTETDKYTIVVYDAQGTKIKEIGCGNTAPQTILFNK